MVTVTFTEHALDDLEQIAEYISKDSAAYAFNFVRSVFEKTAILPHQPKIGRMVPEFGTDKIRELIYGRYRIVYRLVSSKDIDVVTIHHSAQILSKDSLL